MGKDDVLPHFLIFIRLKFKIPMMDFLGEVRCFILPQGRNAILDRFLCVVEKAPRKNGGKRKNGGESALF